MDIKGNPGKPGVSQWWLMAGLGVALLQLLLVVSLDERLPEPLPLHAPPEEFSAERAYRHLLALTNLGPRVAGSLESEVLAVGVAVRALEDIARTLPPHHTLDIDVFRYDGNYSITFLDGMSTAYRAAGGVVARLRGAGSEPAPAALLNCHLDTVPDSPGAHDDALGCAVALESLRALAATPRALRHHTLLLLNAAEENIMQASHAFLTHHPWAKWARVFVNVEACGAGGRELLFRATHDYWLLQEYASRAPHPRFASLAQELFEWGLVPADTDYRIFAEHNLSGVDLAWVADGYAYHTRLDDAASVSLGATQRSGDNVLRLLHGILAQRELVLSAPSERVAPLYFDVLGLAAVVLSGQQAAAAAVLLLLAAAAVTWYQVPPHYVGRRAVWARAVCACALGVCAGAGAGAVAAGGSAVVLGALGARMLAHARPLLLLPHAALPGVVASWLVVRRLAQAHAPAQRALLAGTACRALSALALAAALAAGLRSGLLPALWLAGWSLWARGPALAPALSALYWMGSARDLLSVLLPAAARAAPHANPDILVIMVTGFAAVVAVSWLLPTVLAANNIDKVLRVVCAAYVCGVVVGVCAAWGAQGGGAYSASRPQRQYAVSTRAGALWLPDMDVNSRATHRLLFPEGGLRETNCSELYCGAPYFLPALSLVPSGQWAPTGAHADHEDHARIHVTIARDHPAPTTARVNVTVIGEKHIVIIVSPAAGGTVSRLGPVRAPVAGPDWGHRRTYMLTLFDARPKHLRTPWHIPIYIEHEAARALSPACALSAAGHAMSGRRARPAAVRALAARAPRWLALSAWTADLHLLHI